MLQRSGDQTLIPCVFLGQVITAMSNVQPYQANIQPFEIDLNLLKANFLDPNKINKKQGYKKLTKRILGKSECPLKHQQQPGAHIHACTHAHQLNVIVSSATTYM